MGIKLEFEEWKSLRDDILGEVKEAVAPLKELDERIRRIENQQSRCVERWKKIHEFQSLTEKERRELQNRSSRFRDKIKMRMIGNILAIIQMIITTAIMLILAWIMIRYPELGTLIPILKGALP